jgi:hypothetical protein
LEEIVIGFGLNNLSIVLAEWHVIQELLYSTFALGCALTAPFVKYSLMFLSLASRAACSSWRAFLAARC